MNRTFKVAKSLTRGVVVTSEKASSYQGKAVKTVIAAAVSALVAGAAMASDATLIEGYTVQEGVTNSTVSTKVELGQTNTAVGNALTFVDGADLSFKAGQILGGNIEAAVADNNKNVVAVKGGTINVKTDFSAEGAEKKNTGLQAQDFTMAGGVINLEAKGNANNWQTFAHVGGETSTLVKALAFGSVTALMRLKTMRRLRSRTWSSLAVPSISRVQTRTTLSSPR